MGISIIFLLQVATANPVTPSAVDTITPATDPAPQTPPAAEAKAPKVPDVFGPNQPVQPWVHPSRWFTDADYPSRAIRNEEAGLVRYRLMVGPNGRASDCKVIVSSGSAILDSETCKIAMRRARFSPATDDKGTPVLGEYRGFVEWGYRARQPADFLGRTKK